MDDILRVQDLIRELEQLPLDAPVLIGVVKYPDQFELSDDWDISQAVEVLPLETGEVFLKRGAAMMVVELADFEEDLGANIPGSASSS